MLISKSLKHLEDLLVNYGFIRVHRSRLLNLNFVSRIDKVDGGVLVFFDGAKVSISVRKRKQLFKLIEKM
ncbi:MAG TPA: LytTR family DNA-binding domain-containing protein [Tenuifilaceae bacterium]|nr:LytTR family DNA-binding domain-containing protein [Tenuifilaceae bacterium]HPE18037.1 LytTR family DNA-binding domain-containing protein [Tenuifilaceae bacterium]HPJ44600.1 LytTR family DNA-binding domain-containing protein [Tenuifilaceae bacterium]HPQ34448.1 LytTR family DNA-binding domain-containing protein [Tenuifilaceae bacterium]HRX68913.1 LytTR family DNA-binding domain-containing protein [Tenuifilaceae bacterium]